MEKLPKEAGMEQVDPLMKKAFDGTYNDPKYKGWTGVSLRSACDLLKRFDAALEDNDRDFEKARDIALDHVRNSNDRTFCMSLIGRYSGMKSKSESVDAKTKKMTKELDEQDRLADARKHESDLYGGHYTD